MEDSLTFAFSLSKIFSFNGMALLHFTCDGQDLVIKAGCTRTAVSSYAALQIINMNAETGRICINQLRKECNIRKQNKKQYLID